MSLYDDEMDSTRRGFGPRPLVRLGAIGEGWALLWQRPGTWLLSSLIVVVCYSALSGVVAAIFKVRLPGGPGGFRVSVPPAGAVTQAILTTILLGFFLGGMIRMACRQVRGLPFGVDTLFSITDVLERLILGSAILGAAIGLGFALFVIPGFIAAGVLMFTIPLIVDGGLPATEAASRSWHALKGQWFVAAVFHAVVSFLSGVGSCFCGVGLVFTAPLYALSIAVLYRDFFLAKGIPGAFPGKGPMPDL
jgi:hypothetical protein